MAGEGSKQVEVRGLDDKHEITALLTTTLSGQLLSPQFLYAGRTPRCYPSQSFLVAGISIIVQCRCHTCSRFVSFPFSNSSLVILVVATAWLNRQLLAFPRHFLTRFSGFMSPFSAIL